MIILWDHDFIRDLYSWLIVVRWLLVIRIYGQHFHDSIMSGLL